MVSHRDHRVHYVETPSEPTVKIQNCSLQQLTNRNKQMREIKQIGTDKCILYTKYSVQKRENKQKSGLLGEKEGIKEKREE